MPSRGHLTVTPLAPFRSGSRRASCPTEMKPVGRRLLADAARVRGTRGCRDPASARSPVRHRSDLRRVFDRSIPYESNVDAQIFFVAQAPARARRCARRLAAGERRRGVPGAAAQSAGNTVHARRLGWRGARGDAGDHVRRVPGVDRHSAGAAGEFHRIAGRRRASSTSSPRARHRGMSTNVLLLAGVTMNAFFSALILFVQYFADFAETFRILRWLMGDLDVSSYDPIVAVLPLMVFAFAVFAWLARPLNLLSLGPDAAESRGLDVTRAQRAAFFSASLATGAAVSVGGPVGFIGIIVPAPRATTRRLRPPHRPSRVGAVRRRVPDWLRCARAHRHVARWSCPSASSPHLLEGRSSYGCWCDEHDDGVVWTRPT